LTHINLGSNNIGADGAKYIAESLKFNSTLTYIDLFPNNSTLNQLIQVWQLFNAIVLISPITFIWYACHLFQKNRLRELISQIWRLRAGVLEYDCIHQ
jgi:hypothetical protein